MSNLRSQRLNQATHAPHERLDRAVKAHDPFSSRENFSPFVQAQYLFQSELQALYQRDELIAIFPDLAARCRARQAEADLADLGATVPAAVEGAPGELSRAEALGWLFVSEGSKLGAAFLIKRVAALGLSESFGARHLGEPEGGRAAGWKLFTHTLDALQLSEAEDRAAEAGALAAFERFADLLQHSYAQAKAA